MSAPDNILDHLSEHEPPRLPRHYTPATLVLLGMYGIMAVYAASQYFFSTGVSLGYVTLFALTVMYIIAPLAFLLALTRSWVGWYMLVTVLVFYGGNAVIGWVLGGRSADWTGALLICICSVYLWYYNRRDIRAFFGISRGLMIMPFVAGLLMLFVFMMIMQMR